ncbi:MAG: 50S ribosomal protein L35 [Mycoplasmataceae bacterium]|nr:MAG: 50S ribosomal protein L35 [Mycoplasmataceae bacterium]
MKKIKKIKFKSKSAFEKRFKITGSGKVKRARAYTSHLFGNKSTKQKRHLRKSDYLSPSDYKRSKPMLNT